MKKLFLIYVTVCLYTVVFAQKVKFMPHWYPQAQFAGYYMAQEEGYYEEEGLEVEIRHLTKTSKYSAFDNLCEKRVDIITAQLLQAMAMYSEGKKMVNVLQTSQNCGLCCIGHNPITDLKSLNGLTITRWKNVGFSCPAVIAAYENNLDIRWIPVSNGINVFILGAADATLAYYYSEIQELVLGTGEYKEAKIMKFADYGYNYPEDGLYVMEDWYADSKNREIVEKFNRATKQGWDYARENPEETVEVVKRYMKNCNFNTSDILQERMLREVLSLQVNKTSGKPDFSPVSREVFEQIVSRGVAAGVFRSVIDYDKFIK